jgi:hypothetical protein
MTEEIVILHDMTTRLDEAFAQTKFLRSGLAKQMEVINALPASNLREAIGGHC